MKKRICFFHTEFTYSGGAEKLIFRQMEYLKGKGFGVSCFAAFVDPENCFPGEIINYDVRQILPTFLNKIFPHDFLILLTFFLFPLVIFRFRHFDLFIGENQAGPGYAFLASLIWRKPFFTYQPYPITLVLPRQVDRGSKRRTSLLVAFLLKVFRPAIVIFDRWVFKKAAVVFANGGYARKILVDLYKREVNNCPAGAEKGRFNRETFDQRYRGYAVVKGIKIRKPYLLVTNRHFPAKRLDLGIKALDKLPKYLTLAITGSKTFHTRRLEEMVKELKLEGRVVFTGLVDEENLGRLYQNALVYLYTAPEEDFGMGIVEAMAYGVPVVAWDNAGPSQIVEDGLTGYLARPGDLDVFSGKTEDLIQDRGLNFKMAKAAFAAAERFSWENHGWILEGAVRKYV